MEEDWAILSSFFPQNWVDLAFETDALKGLRKDKAANNYLRTLLIHIGCGYSLRDTAARAKQSGLADISDVALLWRLRKAKDWLHSLCLNMFREYGLDFQEGRSFTVRLFDATNVKEPGKTGSVWRIHYSVQLPSLNCDFFKLSASKGKGTGESFFQYPIKKGDYIIADRGYSTASGIHHVASKGAHVMVRVNTKSLPMLDSSGVRFPLLEKVSELKKAGDLKSWPVLIPNKNGDKIRGRLCAIRKTEEAIKISQEKAKKEAVRGRCSVLPATLEYAKHVIVFTTFPAELVSDFEILRWYRSRWQVELIFKRFKSIAELGHLPKSCEESSKAWLYGKLFVALLTEKLIHHAESISPWGYNLEAISPTEPLA